MIRTLVVDDEPLARERVCTLLAAHSDFEVVGECEDGLDALARGRDLAPDVVFLDIQMPGLTGLEVAEAWQQDGKPPYIVFVTAFDQYAVQAFRLHALDYLMKPIRTQAFGEALSKVQVALGQKDRGAFDQRLQALLEAHDRQQRVRPHLLVKEGERYVLVRTADIQAIEATGNYVCLHCERGQHLLRGSLSSLEGRFDPERFVRTHRSWIANLDQVKEAQPWARGGWILLTRHGLKIPVSPQHREALLKRLG